MSRRPRARPRPARALPLVALALAAPIAPLAAQGTAGPTLTAEVGANGAYVARGLTVANRFVVQPAVTLAGTLGGLTWAAGAWGSVEPARYDGARDISETGDAAAVDLAEVDLWAEVARPVGRATLTLGALAYRFPNRLGTTAAANTVEAYARVALDAPLAPSLALWYDVDEVRGAYLEAAIERALPSPAALPLALAATVGYTAGHERGRPSELYYYERAGVTHGAVALSSSVAIAGVDVAPSATLVLGRDAATRVSAPGRTRGAKLWVGATLGWTRPVGAAGR